jgi:hypothetical protein
MTINEWVKIRRLLWDDDEYILIVDDFTQTKPMKLAGKITAQPKKQFCCGNSFRPSSSRRRDNVQQFHTWVIEFDSMPIDEQRKFWEKSSLPHTLRIFSGNKSIHVYIRIEETVSAEEWQDIANNLKLIFPDADKKVLTDRCRLSRLPNGYRESVAQKVETTKTRIPLKSLTEWLESQDVIKDKGIKAYSDTAIKKNILDSTSSPAQKIMAMNQAKEEFERKNPKLIRLYDILVERRYQIEPDSRNETLIEMITFLHDAVCKDVAMAFAEQLYLRHLFSVNDPLEKHLQEALAHWDALEGSYPARLNPYEQDIYSVLTPQQKVVFRIARSFSYGESMPDKLFNLPMTATGHRLKLDTRQVEGEITNLRRFHVIGIEEKGTKCKLKSSGEKEGGDATIYRWLV